MAFSLLRTLFPLFHRIVRSFLVLVARLTKSGVKVRDIKFHKPGYQIYLHLGLDCAHCNDSNDCPAVDPLVLSSATPSRKSSTLPTETSEALDPDIAVGLNEISTEALKVMLGEDIQQLMRFKDKVDVYGEYLVEEKQLEPAKFMMVIRGMLDHQVVPEATDLQGPYKKAFEKIWGVVEDSGWLLTQPGAEGGEVEMVDDELIPPVLVYKY